MPHDLLNMGHWHIHMPDDLLGVDHFFDSLNSLHMWARNMTTFSTVSTLGTCLTTS